MGLQLLIWTSRGSFYHLASSSSSLETPPVKDLALPSFHLSPKLSRVCSLRACRAATGHPQSGFCRVVTHKTPQQQCGSWKPGSGVPNLREGGGRGGSAHKWPFPRRPQDLDQGILPSKLLLLTKTAPSWAQNNFITVDMSREG